MENLLLYLQKNKKVGFIGKERDAESQLADHGVRKYDPDLGRFTLPDPLWEKYYCFTPWQYSFNNPLGFKDDNGKDAYLAIWSSGGQNGAGHSVIAFDDYDKNGNSNGLIRIYDLVPSENVNKENATKDVTANYRVNIIPKDQFENLDYKTFSINENGDNPNGVLSISTNGLSDDRKIDNSLKMARKNNPNYNGVSFNCSSYVQEGLRGINNLFGAYEYINVNVWGFNIFRGLAVTPNFLFKRTTEVFETETIVDPGENIKNNFLEAIK